MVIDRVEKNQSRQGSQKEEVGWSQSVLNIVRKGLLIKGHLSRGQRMWGYEIGGHLGKQCSQKRKSGTKDLRSSMLMVQGKVWLE